MHVKMHQKSLDPSWRETFSLPLTKDYSEDEKPIDFGINGPILEVTCEDIDTVSSADFMGELNLPVFVRRPSLAFSFFFVWSFYATGGASRVRWHRFGAAPPRRRRRGRQRVHASRERATRAIGEFGAARTLSTRVPRSSTPSRSSE